ncbi:YesL family protein [Ruminiclostridium cellulolyticum]|uniref:Uncharacterized protein n=1 Tax=Ruminiclostridium cellulolyticum (strain ATCC 35319 / DSM 5812 / JCM 6584 / H10) TaxID=394503 RepID=B8I3H9_RUMCH|nr:DUF624 domain-containing protein [Ruminiclostridium cellulolyticum]ACL76322.1 conserved hypothetical protein [Ruminiclostridium cellulolyticum H10]
MGLFSSNYNKPGPGVEKDAPPKPRFFIFFEVLKRKFWHLIRINLLYILCNIPALLLALYVSTVYLQKINIDNGGFSDFYIRVFLAAIMMFLSVITIGPVQAGFTYIMRNYSREEHAFIWWDFKDNFIKNFKQGMIITGIDFVVMYILGIALNFYLSMEGILSTAASAFVFLSIVIYCIMHLYLYPMLVTVKLSIKNLYKNAFIFSILKLLPNILFLILNILIAYATFYNPVIGVILYLLIIPSVIGLMNNFFVNPIIKRYVVDPLQSTAEEIGEDEEDTDDDNGEGFYKKELPEEND